MESSENFSKWVDTKLALKIVPAKSLIWRGFSNTKWAWHCFRGSKSLSYYFKTIKCIKSYSLRIQKSKTSLIKTSLKKHSKIVPKTWNQLILLAWRGGTTFLLNSANKIDKYRINPTMTSVLTRILSGTVFDRIGTKKSNLALKWRICEFLEMSWH